MAQPVEAKEVKESKKVQKSEKPSSRFKLRSIIGAGVIVLILLAVYSLSGSTDIAKDGEIDDREAVQILTEVQKLIQIPQEKPVLALVTNADTLIKEQTFYRGVTNGDILILFPQARKAVLFNMKDKKLLNVGPINLGEVSKDVTSGDETTLTLPTSSTNQ